MRTKSVSPAISGRAAWYTSLGPEAREIVSRDAWGKSVRAVELNPTGIIHGAGVTSIKQDNGGNVRLTVRNEKLEQEQTITSRYVMCADGGRHFANEFGVRLQIFSVTLLSAATSVVANEVVSLYLPNWDGSVGFNGQVLGNDGPTTTYALECATKNDDCPFTDVPITIVEGPSTLMYSYPELSATANCNWGSGNKNASCTITEPGLHNSTFTTTIADPVAYYGVTITATATRASQSNSASATPKATGTSSSSPTGSSASASSDSSTSAAATSTATDNAAVSQITARAPWSWGRLL
ncbi:hypothetical protein BDV29DRAFT_153043 [Aspergillus leporis]|uniref:Uncharacterized protein n=1 Tax=Aspergillus leporis TaxID=41062 RepID=A0A5N5XBN3_9EURO|nr:hypothetical protein BDV29DRAFT_153043 [Aspergillus leporis]